MVTGRSDLKAVPKKILKCQKMFVDGFIRYGIWTFQRSLGQLGLLLSVGMEMNTDKEAVAVLFGKVAVDLWSHWQCVCDYLELDIAR